MSIHKSLSNIQVKLVAKKSAWNKHGSYNYRNVESILEALKPLLAEHNCYVHLTDDVVMVGDRFYVKATASLFNDKGDVVSTTAFARESVKGLGGMSEAQTTGSSSSYARKYALGGLFAIDNGDDDDKLNKHGEDEQPPQQAVVAQPVVKSPLDDSRLDGAIKAIKDDAIKAAKEGVEPSWTVKRLTDTYELRPDQLARVQKEVG